MHELLCENLFRLDASVAAPLFSGCRYPWEVLPKIKSAIDVLGASLPADIYEHVSEHVWIARSAKLYPSVCIEGACIIGEGTVVRHSAFIRGDAIIGRDCVIGNSTEIKNSIVFDRAQLPHFNYVGDSVIGYAAHMGAGAITSNIKSDKTNINLIIHNTVIPTGLRKFGAMLGDRAEIGCNSVLNPGTVIGRDTNVYPLSMVRGYIPADSILKTGGIIISKNKGEST